ncbi:MAG: hypothetical protein CVV02_11790 [Firmicutes bacterium HGW-Firmicutes-7]|nr:MAG: hypothetical protein CVV02_11790 [Firmicutes bacterium HGW-Firmicutes-7]
MKRIKILSIVMALSLICGSFLSTVWGEPKIVNAKTTQPNDISNHWAKEDINKLVNMGAINGYPDGSFKPNNTMTRAAFIKVIVLALNIDLVGQTYFKDTENHWANDYISAAVDYGILDVEDYGTGYASFNPDQNITRLEIATMVTKALGEEYAAVNDHGSTLNFSDSETIPTDLKGFVKIADREKIIAGYPDNRFIPNNIATRAEASVMVIRMLDSLKTKPTSEILDGEQIYKKFEKSVVTVLTYDKNGDPYGLGTGVVIKNNGQILTNYHVIESADKLEVKFSDGVIKKVVDIYNYDRSKDIAILNIEGSGYQAAPIGNSRKINTGETIFTIGSPFGLEMTMSDGIISTNNRKVDDNYYIQISAPISSGNSGGPLINKYGQVIGINSDTFGYFSQNLNLSIPVANIASIIHTKNQHIPITEATIEEIDFYNSLEIDGYRESSLEVFAQDSQTNFDKKTSFPNNVFTLGDYKYLSWEINLQHNPQLRDNMFWGTIIIRNSYLDTVVYYDYYQQSISKGQSTTIERAVDYYSLEKIGVGEYDVEFYLNDVLIDANTLIIKDDTKFKDFGVKKHELVMMDADYYIETGNINNKKMYKQNSDHYFGYNLTFYTSKTFEADKGIFFKSIIKGPDMVLTYYHCYPIEAGINESGANFWIDMSDPISWKEGKYTLEIYADDKLYTQTDFVIQKSNFTEIKPQNITLDTYLFDEVKQVTNKFEYYDFSFFDFSYKLGDVDKEMKYGIRVVLKNGEEVIEEKERLVLLTNENSNEVITYTDFFVLHPTLFHNVEVTDDVKIEVYVNDDLIITKPIEVFLGDNSTI